MPFSDPEKRRANYAKNRDRLRAYMRDRYAANRERRRAEARAWHEKNKERINAKRREDWAANRKERNARNKGYRSANPERYRENARKRYLRNREKLIAAAKSYYEAHKEEYREKRRTRAEEERLREGREPRKRLTDEQRRERGRKYLAEYMKRSTPAAIRKRLATRLRGRLFRLVVRNSTDRQGSAVRDLGCTVSDLKTWLEVQFQPGMCWANYGAWHIDHVLPLSSFDLTDRKQVLVACNWMNLQPLWAADNIRKGARA